jgi:hypothetical protein
MRETQAAQMNLEARIERLEQTAPTDIVLWAEDGSEFHYIHGVRRFVADALAQVAGGGGPIIDACRRTVRATRSVGLLHEVFAVMVEPEEGKRHGKRKHHDRRRSRSVNRRRKANDARA